MVIERDWKNHGHYEEQDQDPFVIGADNQQKEEADQQDHEFGGDDISENCANEKAVFALE